MPYLAFENSPPPPSNNASRGLEPKNPTSRTDLAINSRTSTQDQVDSQEVPESKYPIVKIDTDAITDSLAGRLATSLLGHVLFLKNQVPFPVMHLGRIPGSKTNTRAAKQREELLASYDTISSHLETTFSALSTALACCSGNSQKLARVHLAILVGPSVTTAKSKLILGIDGLEMRVWGSRVPEPQLLDQSGGDVDDDDDEGEGSDETPPGCGDEADESDESDEGPESSDTGSEAEDDDDDDDDDEEEGREEEDEGPGDENSTNVDKASPSNGSVSFPPPVYISRAEEQKFLQNADRLLSRTLAAADADGKGISSELSPTYTHILIRAPRRFNHPAWVPRQNATSSLDSYLQDFQNNSGLHNDPDEEIGSRPKRSKKSPVEGVWITTRQGLHHPQLSRESSTMNMSDEKLQEDDEMMWWSWDGKFQGFSDW